MEQNTRDKPEVRAPLRYAVGFINSKKADSGFEHVTPKPRWVNGLVMWEKKR